jgi:tetratricopeptide (TPR) repeat protein
VASSKKQSRKDLKKDDEFVSRGQEIVAWASQYTTALVAAGVVVLLVVIVGTVVSTTGQQRATAAASALGAALEIADRPVFGLDDETIDLGPDGFANEDARTRAFREALEEVRRDHAGTTGGALAALYLGNIALEAGEHDAALANYERYLAEAPRGHTMRFAALEGIGVVHEAKEDLEAALSAYERLAREGNAYYRPFGLLHQARILAELGRHDQARSIAQQIVDEHAGSGASRQARDLLGRLPASSPGATGVAEAAPEG